MEQLTSETSGLKNNLSPLIARHNFILSETNNMSETISDFTA